MWRRRQQSMKVTPLHSAAAAIVAKLSDCWLRTGLLRCPTRRWLTALHEAAQIGDQEMIKTLLNTVPIPTPQITRAKTPVQMAQAKGHDDIVKLLSRPSGDFAAVAVRFRGQKKKTPLIVSG